MKIIARDHHHAEVTEPDVWASTGAGRLLDVTIELPDHLVELTPEEATRLWLALNRALAPHLGAPAKKEAA